ncbi:Uma2 family endonuclease [Thiomicrorhabdus indica]|uniref:Uma2 family endonuclease n=1 Tax=Thiomicrorhabdus indica TaxID=2267253 RepID=UPI002AA87551|nr:Uma2 family endonuclease [Thiomicrorhabdus indica]
MAVKVEYLPEYTYQDYLDWEGDWELIQGVPYAMAPAPTIKHQLISNALGHFLYQALERCEKCKSLIAADWKIDNETVVQPDNLVICHTPMHPNYLSQSPELIFEILSPSTAKKDQTLKFELYEKEGVKFYVLVDPEEEVVKAYELKEGRYVIITSTHSDSLTFNLSECSVEIPFAKIWK